MICERDEERRISRFWKWEDEMGVLCPSENGANFFRERRKKWEDGRDRWRIDAD